jgi:phosphohistidine phosphatase
MVEPDARGNLSLQIYLVRHAIAAERGPQYPDEADRPLTARGIERLKHVLERLKDLDVECQRILCSPARRTRQTGELASRKLRSPLELCPELQPGGNYQELPWAAFRGDTMVVGHEPDLSELAGWLLTGEPRPAFRLRKSGVACLERDQAGAYRLNWLLTPAICRAFG